MRTLVPPVVMAAAVLLLYVFVPGIRERPWSEARIFGAAAAGAGFLLVCLARVQLGASFSIRPEARELVTHGLYSRLRNPMYVFLDVMLFGLILVFEAPWLFAVLAGLVAAQSIQARREGAVLAQKFGETYAEYRRRTWF